MSESGVEVRPVLLGDGWQEDRPGGLNRYLADLFGALRGLGSHPRAALLGPASAAPVGVSAGGRLGQPLPMRLWEFQRAARRAAIDATLVDAHFALTAFGPTIFGRLRRLPLVVHFQGPWAAESLAAGTRPGWSPRAKRMVELAVYRRARRIIVLSGAFKRYLVEEYGIDPWRIALVPPGVDLGKFSPGDPAGARRRLGLPEDAQVVVTVRRLVPRMGLDVLLEAWPAVVAGHPRALLLVAGEGPERVRLERLAARIGIEASVRFLGRVDEDTLVDCYRAAKVSVVPTVALEGFGLIVLESLACGTPVVASDVGALPEALAGLDPGLIVPSEDAGALAGRIVDVLETPASVPDAAACRRYAERFDWQGVARRHLAIYADAQAPAPPDPRVLYLGHSAKPAGGELALLRLLPALGGIDRHVVLAEDGPLVGQLLWAGISVEVRPMAEAARGLNRRSVRPGRLPAASVLGTVRYTLGLARTLRRLRPDLVHTNSLKAALYGGVAARLAGVPVVWHLRDRIAGDYLPAPAVRLVRVLARHLPAAVIANSQTTLATVGPVPVPTAVVPSPVPVSFFDRDTSPGGPALRVGMVGRLAAWKGQHVFLEAFASAFPAGDERATIVGAALFAEGDYEHRLQRQAAELGLDGRVAFTGFVDDVPAQLATMDVVVHASLTPEPFGLVIVEAMAMGRPVVAANAGGPAETIKDGVDGLLYPPGDVTALAKALERLAEDPELRVRLGAAARERARAFAPDAIAEQVKAVYRQVLAGRVSP